MPSSRDICTPFDLLGGGKSEACRRRGALRTLKSAVGAKTLPPNTGMLNFDADFANTTAAGATYMEKAKNPALKRTAGHLDLDRQIAPCRGFRNTLWVFSTIRK